MMHSLKGQLLVAVTDLRDPNFARTITLIVEHNDEGALGLTLNRPTDTTFQEVWDEISGTPSVIDDVIYRGGPCEGPLMVLHTDPRQADQTVMDGIYFTTEEEEVMSIVAEPAGRCRFFVGYAGWSASQLERELEAGSWLYAPATADHIFLEDERHWLRLHHQISLSRSGVTRIPVAHLPADPSVN
ncbi:MAG: YqgE/AlgH family protein [Phycisphaeraceae bacterium]